MAYPINPNNDNIDNLSPNFRDFVLGRNLQSINPELEQSGFSFFGLGDQYDENSSDDNIPDTPSITDISGQYRDYNLGRNLPLRNPDFDDLENTDNQFYARLNNYLRSRGQQYRSGDLTEQISDAGNVESNVHVYRDIVNLTENTYGPAEINYYNCPDKPVEVTGFQEYSTQVGGDFRSSIIGSQLGFSSVSGIDFESELADIGSERRTFEISERIKLNFISDTIGTVNLDPFNLLTGQDLIEPNYRITAPETFLGRAAEFTASLAGLNAPTSIIPGSREFTKIGSDQFQQDLLDYTGKGQRTTLFDNVFINKYTPSQILPENTEDRSKLANAVSRATVGPNPPEPATYLSTPEQFSEVQISREERERSISEKINQATGSFVDNLVNRTGGNSTSLQPNPESLTLPLDPRSVMGADSSQPGLTDLGFDTTLDENDPKNDYGDFVNPKIGAKTDTLAPEYGTGEATLPSIEGLMDWRERPSTITTFQRASFGSGNGFSSTETLGEANPFRRGLLRYTQDLINNARNNPTGEKSAARYIGIFDSDRNIGDFEKSGVEIKAHTNFSKGNLVKSSDDSYYCRSWSTRNPYHKQVDLIRSDGLRGRGNKVSSFSVLGDNGMPKIAPYNNTPTEDKDKEIRKYMLSIENLAWKDSAEFFALPNCEQGYFGGRIMWFPPYNIDFTDNTSVSWETHNFIGRSEPIYTYNYTERKGTLSFTIIMDNPSILHDENQFDDDEKIWKFFAGCSEVDLNILQEFLPKDEINEMQVAAIESAPQPRPEIPIEPETTSPPIEKVVGYFRNAEVDKIENGLRVGVGRNIEDEIFGGYETGSGGLNENFLNDLNKLIDFLKTEEGQKYSVLIKGFTSGAAPNNYNKVLSIDRAGGAFDLIYRLYSATTDLSKNDTKIANYGYVCQSGENCKKAVSGINTTLNGLPGYDSLNIIQKSQPAEFEARWNIIALGEANAQSQNDENNIVGDNDPNALQAKLDRRVEYSLELNETFVAQIEEQNLIEDPQIDIQFEENLNPVQVTIPEIKKMVNVFDECSYFKELEKDSPFIYDEIKEKIKFFHPSFHSMTPEGFNSRLNFLMQCTRPGNSTILNDGQVQEVSVKNLAFGRPPVCILRIGDFYHTKIIIDSVNFSFDPLQWDLNPEGVGVQPMLAKVDLNFSFIGGSSLGGPIKQLQNALSYNFFANTSVYNPITEKKVKVPKDGSTDFNSVKNANEFVEKTVLYGAYVSPEEYEERNTIEQDSSNIQVNNTGTESEANNGSPQGNNLSDTNNADNVVIEKSAEQSDELKEKINENEPGSTSDLTPKPPTGCASGKSVDLGFNRNGTLDRAKNVIVGSSSVGVLDSISSTNGQFGGFNSNRIYVYYNCGGKTLSWLTDQIRNDQNVYESVQTYFQVGIGTNDGFPSNLQTEAKIREYTNLVRERFPNAKLYVIEGTYGWGGVANKQKWEVVAYYEQYTNNGWAKLVPKDDNGAPVTNFLPVGNHDPNNPWFQRQMQLLREFGV